MSDMKVTPEKRAKFLSILAECGNVTRAAEESECGRVMLYKIKREDEDFSAAWEEAAEIGSKRLEDEARRRAVEGWQEPVWYQGDQVGTVRKYSDTLLICLLKAHHPERYRENIRQELSGPNGSAVQIEHSSPEILSLVSHLIGPEKPE